MKNLRCVSDWKGDVTYTWSCSHTFASSCWAELYFVQFHNLKSFSLLPTPNSCRKRFYQAVSNLSKHTWSEIGFASFAPHSSLDHFMLKCYGTFIHGSWTFETICHTLKFFKSSFFMQFIERTTQRAALVPRVFVGQWWSCPKSNFILLFEWFDVSIILSRYIFTFSVYYQFDYESFLFALPLPTRSCSKIFSYNWASSMKMIAVEPMLKNVLILVFRYFSVFQGMRCSTPAWEKSISFYLSVMWIAFRPSQLRSINWNIEENTFEV